MAKRKTHPGSITKRGSKWRIRLCVGGQYHSYTVDGTKTDAQNYATEKYAELTADHERAQSGMPGPIRFSALLTEFETQELPGLAEGTRKSYGDAMGVFRTFFVEQRADPRVDKVRRADVKAFVAWRRTYRVGGGDGVSRHTVAKDLRVLKRLMNFAVDLDYADANPCARVKAPKPDPRTPPILTDDQFETLLAECSGNPMLRLYVLLLGETGARAYSEALQLRWEDVDLAGGFLHIRSATGRRTKSGKSRHVPLTPRLRTALQEHAAAFRMALYDGNRSEFVFHHTRTRRKAVAGQRIRSFKTSFASAVKRAKLPDGFRAHDLRHRRVTSWLAKGANPVHVKEAVGHASLATTMGYTHLVPEHLRALVDETQEPARKVEGA